MISNSLGGRGRLEEVFGDRVLILPYVKPGFDLAKQFHGVADQLHNYEGVISAPIATIDPAKVDVVAHLHDSGPLTPEHVIHNKPFPAIVDDDSSGFSAFAEKYRDYFEEADDPSLTMLDPFPHWAIYRSGHCRSYGSNLKRATVSADVARTTLRALARAEILGGWSGLSTDELRELEYWELEQAKLRRQPKPLPLTGRIAVVTGAASGIGRACAGTLLDAGAVVVGLDIADSLASMRSSRPLEFSRPASLWRASMTRLGIRQSWSSPREMWRPPDLAPQRIRFPKRDSPHVALAVRALVDGTFARTTGAQLPVDGGSDRVI